DPFYFAWYETPNVPLPQLPIPIIFSYFPVNVGDTISAEVKSLGNGQYQASIKNITQNLSSPTETLNCPNNNAKTAEWIVEYPSIFQDLGLSLADFGTEQFSGCSVTFSN